MVMKQYQKVAHELLHMKSHIVLNLRVKVEGIIHTNDVKMGVTSQCVHESLGLWMFAMLYLNIWHTYSHRL